MAESMYVVDAQWLIHQGFHALPPMTGPRGEPTNAIFAFTRDVLNILRKKQPTYLVCAFDEPGPTFRHEMYDQYKANRGPMPDDLAPQIPRVRELVDACRIGRVGLAGYEADDLIGTIACRAAQRDIHVYICTNDKDAWQLVGPRVWIYNPRTDAISGVEECREKLGIDPAQMIDYLALTGDSSDNVPGVRGIGPKTAVKLIGQYGDLETVLAHAGHVKGKRVQQGLTEHADDARLSRRLVTIDTDVPLEFDWEAWRSRPLPVEPVTRLFQELGFSRFVEEIGGHDGAGAGAAPIEFDLIDTPEAYATLLEQLRAQKRFAIDLETTSLSPLDADICGVAVAWEADRGAYLALRTPPDTPHLDAERVLADLKPILEDPAVGKLGQNLKYDALVLRRAGVRLAGVAFDAMVADYLLEAGQRNHNLDALAGRYLSHRMIPISDLIGTGKDQVTIDQVEPERVAEYAVEDAVVALRLAEILEPRLREAGLWDLFVDVELPLMAVLEELEHNGIRVEPSILRQLSADYGSRMAELEAGIHTLAGEPFNVGSPKQLAHVLFEKLGLPVVKKTKTGFSTDQEVLEQLAPMHALPKLVVEHRQLAKLKGTYLDALEEMINAETGRVHASFNQVVTATGRLSSSDPNLQNIPVRTAEGREIRRAFVPGRDGQVLLTADYSQIELRVLAHYSEDPAMTEAFMVGEDIHTSVASRIYGVGPGKVTSEMRRGAKTVNFGIIYGLSPFGLSQRLGITHAEAEEFIDAYFENFAGIEAFIERVLTGARRDGYVTTILGRRRAITGIKNTTGRNRNLAERTAVNTVIQGSAADLIKVAMNRIHGRLRDENRRARMLLQIHDELVFEVDADALTETMALVREEMIGAIPLRVPVVVDMASGPNWLEVA